MSDYVPKDYVTVNDVLKHFGWSAQQILDIDDTVLSRYENWVKEANNIVEAFLFPYSDVLPLPDSSKELTFIRSSALNWVVYKKRDKDGSKNAPAALEDHKRDLTMVEKFLIKTPTTKHEPIHVITTDSTADIIPPYSQNQGYPRDLLY